MTINILHGDCRETLITLPTASVQCVVTSPPYWGLRDYGVDGQIGLEQSPDAYVAEMVAVFREVRRVLRDDGTLWLNLGDSYSSTPPGNKTVGVSAKSGLHGVNDPSGKYRETLAAGHQTKRDTSKLEGIKPKDLIGIPWMVAFALRADGWYLRSDIIWAKPNPMPESVTDRPTSSHEHVFLLTKSARYFYDAEAVREEGSSNPVTLARNGREDREVVGAQGIRDTDYGQSGNLRRDKQRGHGRRHDGFNDRWDKMSKEEQCGLGRNLRNVWTIATAPFNEAHFATFPPPLAERCIRAGTSQLGCCTDCGAPWERITTKGEPDMVHRAASGSDASGGYNGQSTKDHDAHGVQNASDVKRRILEGMREKTYEWKAGCLHAARIVPCTVLDPFAGAFTTAMVADRLQRNAIGIELNESYCEMARKRIVRDAGMFAEITV